MAYMLEAVILDLYETLITPFDPNRSELRQGSPLLCYLAVTGRPYLCPTPFRLLWGDMPEARSGTG